MALSNQQQYRFSLALMAALALSACGGGGGGAAPSTTTATQQSTGGNSQVQGIEVQTVNPGGSTTIGGSTAQQVASTPSSPASGTSAGIAVVGTATNLVLVTPSSDGKSITTSPALYKTGGAAVQKLEDLPEGIANSAWMAQTGTRADLHVVLGNGTYLLTRPWAWTPAQSGRSDSKLYIEAQTAGSVLISGARLFSVPRSVHAGGARTSVDLSTAGLSAFDQMWVNGTRSVLARSPNVGSFYFIKNQVGTWSGSATYGGNAVANQAFAIDPAVATTLRSLTSTQLQAATLVAMHSWTTSYHHVQELNSNNETRVSPVSKWPFVNPDFGTSQRYFIENFPAALDAPGEWYLNPNNRLDYLLTASDKTTDLEVEIPQISNLLTVKGDVAHGKWVQYVVFSGLKFSYAQANVPSAGFADSQSAQAVDAAITMDGARYIQLTACQVSKVGGYAVWLRNNVLNSAVNDCEIFDTGAGGVKLGLADQPADANATAYNSVTGNRIHAIGHRYPGAVGIWLAETSYNTIDNNLIGDTTHSAISVGWTWGTSPSNAHHNTITRNFMYDLAQLALSDVAGIYTLGVSPGTVIKGNVIKNVRAFSDYGAGAWGLYNDEGSSGILMDSNVVQGTSSGGYLLNYGTGNSLTNNVFAKGDIHEFMFGKTVATRTATIDANFVLPLASDFIDHNTSSTPVFTFTRNLVSTAFASISSVTTDCGTGCSLSSNVSLTDGNKLDVPVLRNASGVVTLPSVMSRNWSSVAVTATPSPSLTWATAPAAIAPTSYDFVANQSSVGVTPGGAMTVVPVDRPDLVSVIRNSSNELCLAFKDSSSLNAWEPYARVDENYFTGTTTTVFTLKADATTEFVHEWRDGRSGVYLIGPNIVLSATRGIKIGSRVIGTLPVGQWVTVTVTAQQGTSAKWSLNVTYADGSSVSATDQAPTSVGWAATRALFFISSATATSTPCIGRISISNH